MTSFYEHTVWKCSLLILFFPGCQSNSSLEGDIIIVNVDIVDVENDRLVPSKTVVVKADTIVSITSFEPNTNLDAATISI